MEKAIKKAIEGGYKTIWPTALKGYYGSYVLLDPLFWQALGKGLERDTVEIELCGVKTTIDRMAVPLISYRSWEISEKGYLRGTDKEGKKVFLHRLVKDARKGEFIDHINGNKLDNRASNLRIVSNQQNALNKRSTKLGEYRGVYWYNLKKKWVAQVRFKKKSYYGGYFDDKEKAAEAAESLRQKLFGEYHDTSTKEWWLETWIAFILHLASGGNAESFFNELLK